MNYVIALTTIFPSISSRDKFALSGFESFVAIDETSSCNSRVTFNLAGSLEVVVLPEMELLVGYNGDPVVAHWCFWLDVDVSLPVLVVVPSCPSSSVLSFSLMLLSSSLMSNGSNKI